MKLKNGINDCLPSDKAVEGKCWPVQPIELMDSSAVVQVGMEVHTLGWGSTELDEYSSLFLKQIDVEISSTTVYVYYLETAVTDEYGVSFDFKTGPLKVCTKSEVSNHSIDWSKS